MKTLCLSLLLAATALCFTACNKQYNDNIIEPGNSGNNLNSFNWTGTPPLSAKVNGVPFQAVEANLTEFAGYYGFIAKTADGSMSINPSVPVNAIEGQVYSMPSPANVSYQTTEPLMVLGAHRGKIKIITNNANILEGYFWADMKDYSGQTGETAQITEGYFKVEK